jgi:hypothetical protein
MKITNIIQNYDKNKRKTKFQNPKGLLGRPDHQRGPPQHVGHFGLPLTHAATDRAGPLVSETRSRGSDGDG